MIAETRNHRSKFFIILKVFTAATLATLFSGPALAQSLRTQHQSGQPQSTEEPDLINPDRPGIADGSTVIGAKRFQIESGIQEEFRASGDGREHTLFVPTLLRFGIDSHWEARIEGNTFTRLTTFDSRIHGDTAPKSFLAFGIRWRSKSFH